MYLSGFFLWRLMKVLALIDGEHYPSVIRDALLSIVDEVVAAVVVGSTEKVGSIEDFAHDVGLPVYHVPDGEVVHLFEVITRASGEHGIEEVVDLSGEPALDSDMRFQIASLLMEEGLPYRGADFTFTPSPFHRVLTLPSMMVFGMTKRVGKTAVSGYVARTLKRHGYTPCIVTMGRGGPPEPEVISGDMEITPSYLVQQVDLGKHAASDHWENALISRVTTIGCRRCGGGMAGTPFFTNVVRGAEIANTLHVTFVIMEGSGVTLPPVHTDKKVVVVGAHQPLESLTHYFGPYRILISDLAVVTMCEEPMATPEKVEEVEKTLTRIHPEIEQVHCVFRPLPLGEIQRKKVMMATTTPPEVMTKKIIPYVEETFSCEVVGFSPHLSSRPKLKEDLYHMLPRAEVLLTEVKASAIDIATREALSRGVEVVYMDNVPHQVGGTQQLDSLIVQLAREVSV